MKRFMIGRLSCLMAAVVITIGQPAFAVDQAVIRSADVKLGDGGVLVGSVVTPEAKPVSATRVVVLQGQNAVAETMTNEKGEFSVKGLRNGAHTVQLANSNQPVRFWSASSAPPNANGKLVLVSSQNVVRAQGDSGMGMGGAALLFGGALAVVLITTLDDDNQPQLPPASP
jgi:hypothetical protein